MQHRAGWIRGSRFLVLLTVAVFASGLPPIGQSEDPSRPRQLREPTRWDWRSSQESIVKGAGPGGDSCDEATVIGDGVYHGSTIGATNDGGSPSCTVDYPSADVWFLYSAPCSGQAAMDLCGSPLDTVVSVHDPVCPGTADTEIGCNDDACGPNLYQSFLEVPVTQGEDYLIRVAGWGTDTGDFTLDVACNPGGPKVVIVRNLLSDNGDQDGWADTNETVEMRLLVDNVGDIAAEGLVAYLETDSPESVEILQRTLVVGDLTPRASKTTADGFVFRVRETVSRRAVNQRLTASFTIALKPLGKKPILKHKVTLDLDLDGSGGSGPGIFFESFETGDFGRFTVMNIDEGRSTPEDADGYRCSYADPDRPQSNTYGEVSECVFGVDLRHTEDSFWRIDGPDVPDQIDGGRSFSGDYSIHWGLVLDAEGAFTTSNAALEAIRTSEPINLAFGNVCSASRAQSCELDIDCPPDESCVRTAPNLSFKHQIGLIDDSNLHPAAFDRGAFAADRAVVQAQLADEDGEPEGPWIRLEPYLNPYESQATDIWFGLCMYDPVDDGNDEDDLVVGTARRTPGGDHLRGPSSTCAPQRVFSDQGETGAPFRETNIGLAPHGPGLAGETGVGTWVETRFDLSRFRGRRIRLRFLISTSSAWGGHDWYQIFDGADIFPDDGWWIDDVRVSDTLMQPATVAIDHEDNDGLPVP